MVNLWLIAGDNKWQQYRGLSVDGVTPILVVISQGFPVKHLISESIVGCSLMDSPSCLRFNDVHRWCKSHSSFIQQALDMWSPKILSQEWFAKFKVAMLRYGLRGATSLGNIDVLCGSIIIGYYKQRKHVRWGVFGSIDTIVPITTFNHHSLSIMSTPVTNGLPSKSSMWVITTDHCSHEPLVTTTAHP